MRSILWVLTWHAILYPSAVAAKPSPDRDFLTLQTSVEQAIARAEPAVVCIATGHGLELHKPDTVPESYGSGLVIDASGFVLTCAHVVRNRGDIFVRLPGGAGSYAEIHALDPRSDLAVLQLKNHPARLRAVKFGEGGNLKKGRFVVGLANPYRAGYRDGSPSASWGIVSNLTRRAPGVIRETDRNLQSFHHYGTLIQTDVRIAIGCSGGAILNLDGEVVGITTALAALEGIDTPGGFAMPVDARMRQIIDVLRRGEEVEYGFLGVTLDSTERFGQGVLIAGAIPNGPAQRGGLRRGDVLVAIDDAPVRNNDDLFLLIGSLTAGSEVTLKVIRDRSPTLLGPIKLAKLFVSQAPIVTHKPPAPAGLRVDYASVVSLRSPDRPMADGVVVREIIGGSPAEKVELLTVDRVITRVNGTPVTTPADFYREMQRAGRLAELTVINSDREEVNVRLPTQ